jgi:hypothetical protein
MLNRLDLEIEEEGGKLLGLLTRIEGRKISLIIFLFTYLRHKMTHAEKFTRQILWH